MKKLPEKTRGVHARIYASNLEIISVLFHEIEQGVVDVKEW